LYCAVLRNGGSRLAGYDRLCQIMIDVSIHAGEGELDTGD
jgi:hypothetical protein